MRGARHRRTATFKIAAIDYAATFPANSPVDVPGATAGGALRIETDTARFANEIDLVFPRPAAAPEGAFFYVVRRLEGPEGRVAYETLDQAESEGTGAEATVVTASYPFAGFVSSAGGFDPGGRVAAVTTRVALLLWTYDALAPRRPSPGLINGKVVRPVALPGAATPTYAPVAGALVSGVDVSGQPLWAVGTGQSVAVTQADGTFALWDLRFTGGTLTISATHGGLARTAVVYEAPPDAPRSPAMTAYPHLATVKVTFPPEAPAPPPPAIDVRVFRELGGVRVDTQGLVTVGEPLTIGLTVPASATNPATWLAPTVNGQAQAIQPEPLAGTPTGTQQIVSAPFVPARRARTRSSRARSLPAPFLTLLTCTRCPPIA